MGKGVRNRRETPTSAPMALLLERLGRRWALRVVWELRGGALTFRGLQAACGGVSPGVLQGRLHELRRLGIVEKIPRLGYRLSARGEELYTALEAIDGFASRAGLALPDGN